MYHEISLNLHMHTPYSDGHGSHGEIAEAAIAAGLDAVIVTDHNVWVNGPEGYFGTGEAKVLMMIGEEVHDQARDPQKNHMLVIGAEQELSQLAPDPQRLIDGVSAAGGVSFLAHPIDPANAVFNEPDLSWESWDIQGFTGLEIWNGLSEFKSKLTSKLHAIFYAFNPGFIASGPPQLTLERWDSLLGSGAKVVAVGGSDAHALPGKMGIFSKTIFPYEFHFRSINSHLLLTAPLTGEIDSDKRLIMDALRSGRLFVGYDLPAATNGFRFSAQGRQNRAVMGEEIRISDGITLQVKLPQRGTCRLIKDGKVIKIWQNREHYTYITREVGVFRVEATINYRGAERTWIISNPIYVRDNLTL
jgi:hypothetical protein